MRLPFSKSMPGMWRASTTWAGYQVEASIRRRQGDGPRYHTAVVVRRSGGGVVSTDAQGAPTWSTAASVAWHLAAQIVARDLQRPAGSAKSEGTA